jgi:hypothetical protein
MTDVLLPRELFFFYEKKAGSFWLIALRCLIS